MGQRRTPVGVVLVHGLAHGSWCWRDVLPLLSVPALAVDLPGRAGRPAPARPTIENFVASVVDDVDRAGFDRVVLVGHSMGGMTVPGVAVALDQRVEHLVFISAPVVLPGEDGYFVHGRLTRVVGRALGFLSAEVSFTPKWARRTFCNDMSETQARFVVDNLCSEKTALARDRARHSVLDVPGVPATYVKLLNDRAVRPRRQDEMAARLGSRGRVVEIKAGHDVMISRPCALAEVINSVVGRIGRG